MKSTKKRLILGIIIFSFGIIITIIGALFKIQHWPYGSELLTIGSLIEVIGIVFTIITLIQIYNSKP
ncbi:GldL-related protein [Winogradskyella luteola]|uniref:GldL-related protein n=1 Tax=Winogradskyella luteola TaxID=2828330 RepID=UPI003F74EC7D